MEKDSGKHLFWAESLVMTYMMAFGGGILAPFLLGKPPVMFVNDLIVPMVTLAFVVHVRTVINIVSCTPLPPPLGLVGQNLKAHCATAVVCSGMEPLPRRVDLKT